MSKEQLKSMMIDQIHQIDDEEFLNAVKAILDTQVNSEPVMMLTDEQKRAIELGMEDVAAGRVISNEDVEREIDEWLNE